ncbi:MAG: adenylate/guanylate cyclase domain protein, partial [Spartobacteria bacterium]|nr:adenylate/guanylate cyclase domain protein [Spartobacteria bacterium]
MYSAYFCGMNNAAPAFAAWLDIGDRQFPLVGKTFSLGRSKENNVVFTSAKVSRRHALVHAQGGLEFSLVDLGSSNGTHLNGRRVIQPMGLHHGDVIQIGEQSLVFCLEAPQTHAEQLYATEAQMTVREVNEFTCWFLLMDIENFV